MAAYKEKRQCGSDTAMIKLRITGLPGDVNSFLDKVKELFSVTDESKSYPNSNSKFVRKYVNIEKRGNINE